MASPATEIEVDDKVVRVSNPDRVYFPARGETKLDLVEYYLSVGDGIVNALRERPVHAAPLPDRGDAGRRCTRSGCRRARRRGWRPCGCTSRGGTAPPTSSASPSWPRSIWAVQMSTVEFHPWNSRRADTEKPDEWRIDLDPGPRVHVADRPAGRPRRPRGARRARRHRVPQDQRRQGHAHLRADRARPRLQGRTPGRAGLRPRGGAPVRRGDHHLVAQGPRPRTTCSSTTTRTPATTPSRRRTPCAATRSAPCPPRSAGTRSTTCHPDDFTIATMPARYAELGDLHAGHRRRGLRHRAPAGVGRA